jgi:hypothetical protein
VSPSRESLAVARSLDFSVSRERSLSGLGIRVVVLEAPDGISAAAALERLRAADPNGRYDLNHVFDPSGSASIPAMQAVSAAVGRGNGKRIGLVDGGVDESHAAVRGADITSFNAVSRGDPLPTHHGTALASLLVGEADDFEGALPGARLFAADVFGGEARGGAVDSVARGLAWLAEKDVAVITVSLAGPQNALLESAVDALVARGHIVVAAAGNDGPAAAPAYPGAYPGVIAVTSVDSSHHLQLDAGRGAHISFAALGVGIEAAQAGGGFAQVTGTSYAVPRVGAHFALAMDNPNPTAAATALESVKSRAIDLGSPGRDDSYGYGYLDGATPTASLSP